MWNIFQNTIGAVLAAIIIAFLGIGTTAVIVKGSNSYNPRKKWKILMVLSVVAIGISGAATTSYNSGLAQTSELGITLQWFFGFLFMLGAVMNWINK